jgi:hypothetical protein
MSELPRSAFRFDPELVRAFVQDRLDDAGRATLADEVARMLPFHPGVVLALEQRRARDPYPHALAGYLVPDTTSGTLASLGQLIESRLADDRLDEAGCLALRSLALLADIAPAAAELDRRAAELEHQVRVLRDLVAPVAVRCTDHARG